MKYLVLLFILISSVSQAEVQRVFCDSSREYITTLEFLRKQAGSDYSNFEKQNQALAEYVSSYCSGSAYRFIKVVRLFQRMELGINNAMPVAKEAVKVEDDRVDLFVYVFKRLYLKSGLDLNPNQSIRVAKSFLRPNKVPAKKIKKEFKKLSSFCMSEKGLARNKYYCAEFIMELMSSLEGKETKVADSFIDTYEELTSNKALSFSSYDALVLTRSLVKHGPNAINNFYLGLRYAMSDKGLSYSRGKAVEFGKKMASRSVMETELKFKTRKKSKWWKFW